MLLTMQRGTYRIIMYATPFIAVHCRKKIGIDGSNRSIISGFILFTCVPNNIRGLRLSTSNICIEQTFALMFDPQTHLLLRLQRSLRGTDLRDTYLPSRRDDRPSRSMTSHSFDERERMTSDASACPLNCDSFDLGCYLIQDKYPIPCIHL